MNQRVMAMFLMFVRVWTQYGLTDYDLLKDLTTVFLVFNAVFVLGLFVLLFFILNHFTRSVFQVESKQTNLYIVPNITKGFFCLLFRLLMVIMIFVQRDKHKKIDWHRNKKNCVYIESDKLAAALQSNPGTANLIWKSNKNGILTQKSDCRINYFYKIIKCKNFVLYFAPWSHLRPLINVFKMYSLVLSQLWIYKVLFYWRHVIKYRLRLSFNRFLSLIFIICQRLAF